MTELNDTPFRCGYAAIIGEPNAGKSTFINAVLGTRLSIVTSKPQTTRRRILGFHNGDNHQVLFVDTPGLVNPAYALQRSMLESAKRAMEEADVLLVIIDAPRAIERNEVLPEMLAPLLAASTLPAVAAINKVDRITDKMELLPLMEKLLAAHPFKAVVPISALENDGVDAVIAELVPLLPAHPALYPDDVLSDQPERFFVSEIIREKIFETFRQEVPYATEVFIAEYTEKNGVDVIAADILVERESQKRILIGKGGSAIKDIGTRARVDIEQFLDRKVYLELHVKVREGWRNNSEWVRRLGYDL
ncbi:MAG: GTPase Era [Ignavibacteriae bacterium]|nr:GTPase Era [Ignavibacteriota bacterium]